MGEGKRWGKPSKSHGNVDEVEKLLVFMVILIEWGDHGDL
jgi:hypothetical protein